MVAIKPWEAYGYQTFDSPDCDNPPNPSEKTKSKEGYETILLDKYYAEPMGWSKIIRDSKHPLVIDGQGKAVFAEGFSVMDCHWMIFRNITFKKWAEINDSYPEIGVEHVAFINCIFYNGLARSCFMGGHRIKSVHFENCHFGYTINGTHNAYMSGGHWDGGYPPIEDIEFKKCYFYYTPGGRNNLQFNGRFKKVSVIDCKFAHAQLNAITLIGVQNAVIGSNISYGHNRGSGLVIYDYASHWKQYYNNFKTDADIADFLACHHPCQNIFAMNNTFVVGPKRFSVDLWHSDDPTDGHPAILINNAVHSGFQIYVDGEYKTIQFDYPPKRFEIRKNLLHSPNLNILDIYHPAEAAETSLVENQAWCTKPGVPYIGKNNKIHEVKGNFLKKPEWEKPPEYDFVNLIENPKYDWYQHNTLAELGKPGA